MKIQQTPTPPPPRNAFLLIGVDQALGAGQQASLGYVASLRDITAGRPPAERDSQSGFVVPLGPGAVVTRGVRAGAYAIEAVSPSGVVLSTEVEVAAGETKPVRLQGERSDHEWLGWQVAGGNLGRIQATLPGLAPQQPATIWAAIWDSAKRGEAVVLLPALWAIQVVGGGKKAECENCVAAPSVDLKPLLWFAFAALAAFLLYRIVSRSREDRAERQLQASRAPVVKAAPEGFVEPPSPQDVILLRAPHGPAEWTAVRDAREDARMFPRLVAAACQALEPSASDPQWRVFQITSDEPYGAPAAWCLDTTAGARGGLVKLPLPWAALDGSGWVAIDALAPAEPMAAGRISATVRDPQAVSLLGYLGGGRLAEAEAIVNEAATALFEKGDNPYAAAAGGYVLLATTASFENRDEPWRQWLANLDVRFPWLPDGAILRAASLRQTGEPGVREKALEAFGRGVPVYTEGVRRLRDLLALVQEDDPDGQVARALALVDAAASRCDPQQTFTCMRLGR